jgi:hypothetical protein
MVSRSILAISALNSVRGAQPDAPLTGDTPGVGRAATANIGKQTTHRPLHACAVKQRHGGVAIPVPGGPWEQTVDLGVENPMFSLAIYRFPLGDMFGGRSHAAVPARGGHVVWCITGCGGGVF